MFKKLEERLSMLSRDMEDIKMIQIKLPKMKITVSEMKNIVDSINSTLQKKKISELEDIVIEISKMKYKWGTWLA